MQVWRFLPTHANLSELHEKASNYEDFPLLALLLDAFRCRDVSFASRRIRLFSNDQLRRGEPSRRNETFFAGATGAARQRKTAFGDRIAWT